jgi:hypothetical protein
VGSGWWSGRAAGALARKPDVLGVLTHSLIG